MGWEKVGEWPSDTAAGVYRGAAEIVVAKRSGLTFFERVVLWWHSTTDLPFADVAQDVVVTPNYVYVRKQDGSEARVRRDVLAQGRVEGRRRQYSVPHGTDMVISDRKGDDVERALMSEGELQGWTRRIDWMLASGLMAGVLVAAVLVSLRYIGEGAEGIAEGMYNSERAYGFYASVAIWLFAAFAFFYFPQRLIVDAVGLRSVRGFLGGIRSTIPIEDIRFVEVRHLRVTNKNGTHDHFPVLVHTTKHGEPVRLRSFLKTERDASIDFGERCAKTWNVELKRPAELR